MNTLQALTSSKEKHNIRLNMWRSQLLQRKKHKLQRTTQTVGRIGINILQVLSNWKGKLNIRQSMFRNQFRPKTKPLLPVFTAIISHNFDPTLPSFKGKLSIKLTSVPKRFFHRPKHLFRLLKNNPLLKLGYQEKKRGESLCLLLQQLLI